MDLQVLIATMNQTDHRLLKKMNIQSNAIVGNQTTINKIEEFTYNNHQIKYLSFNEKGVGLNRNNALMRAQAEVCLFADDDMVYEDNYPEIVKRQFRNNPEADVIIFNLYEENPSRYIIKNKFKVNFMNYMRFGAARIAFRTESVTKNAIYFNQHFGGGTEYSNGEDTLFLTECLKKGLNIVAVPEYLATLTEERDSTWFSGYDDKFFKDRGTLFYYISKRWAKLLCLQFVIRQRNKFREDKSLVEAYRLMIEGVNREKQ